MKIRHIHWTCRKSGHWLGSVSAYSYEAKRFSAGWRLRVGACWEARVYKTFHEAADAAELLLPIKE